MSLPLKYLDRHKRTEMYQVSLGEKKEMLAVGKCAKFKKMLDIKIFVISLFFGHVGHKKYISM